MTTAPDSVILAVSLNPALDTTYEVPTVVRGEAQRVLRVTTVAGGKAVNVARVVRSLGGRTHLVLPVGGREGEELLELLEEDDLPHTAVATVGRTRRTVAVVEADGTTTLLNEPGQSRDGEWRRVVATALDRLTDDDIGVLVVSGSLAHGTPPEAVATLVTAGRARGIPVISDTSGAALLASLAAGASVVKPNAHELSEVTGSAGLDGALALARAHPGTVVVASRGPEGMVAVDAAGLQVTARPPAALSGNPTGAGDAGVAAIALGLLRGAPWTEILADAVGASAAAVLEPVAGVVDPARVLELTRATLVTDDSDRP